ncbi:hypothetical protein P5G51_003875 [Virgibacillus sp. 179-BFC.A HS]|uniref:DUF2975 domain-containing protein n=1 Tax=Tigheibacillus jepli TaxID=3035914 RepID=A0ABU5CE95_9BACI|nr:hypothetical protein [Virgibacillus sp. 179-BFC.A HS]MDY0404655.1 hypothetical protein [Virgibacillus sp. 179-BFC.A HS]
MRSNNQKYQLRYEDTTFFGLMKIAGLSILKTWSIMWAVLFTASLLLFMYHSGNLVNDLNELSKKAADLLLSASASIFGIVIASLSVTVALFHESILKSLLESKLLHTYLIPFWKAVVLWATSILLCFLLIFFNSIGNIFFVPYLMAFEVFVFFYATFYTVRLTGLVIQLALQRAQIKE